MGADRHAGSVAGAIAATALRQEGLLRREDLLRAGLGRKAIDHRARSGRLFGLHPGVYALHPGPYARRTLWLAALWWCGEDSALSHVSAGAFLGHGDEPDRSVVHVTTTRQPRSRPGVVVHRTRTLDRRDRLRYGPITVTSPARTLVDEAAMMPFAAWRSRVDTLRKLPVRELEATLARAPNRPGTPAVRRLLAGDGQHTKSVLERRFLRVLRSTGLAERPQLNAWVAGHKADCVFATQRLVVELDGRAHHERRAQMQADRRRDADYQLAGWRILRLTWWDLQPDLAPRTVVTLRAFLRPARVPNGS